MFKRILCGVDGSKLSEKAARYAVQLARLFQAELTLIYVAPLPILQLFTPTTSMITPDLLPQEVEKRLTEQGANLLKELQAKLNQPELKIETRLEFGHPADTICQISKEEAFDLIVVGNRGMSEIKSIFMGSVSAHLVHSCQCPILVVK